MDKNEALIFNLYGFMRYAILTNMPESTILGTVMHDLAGTIKEETCFSPRCSSYGKYVFNDPEPPKPKEEKAKSKKDCTDCAYENDCEDIICRYDK